MTPDLIANPTRWTPLRHHDVQQAYWRSPHRFNTVPAGRRSGKTELAKRKLVRRALSASTPWEPQFFAGAPTRDQAKRIFWDDLKALVGRKMMLGDPSESELRIKTITGASIWVVGLDKPERIEGAPWDGGILTEVGNLKERVWTMHVRPALSDRNGWCDLEGVPEGRNHYYDLHTKALAQLQREGERSEWGAFTWPSSDILPPAEIEAAKRDLDELTFRQEYEASFINFSGQCYYPFRAESHCAPLKYDDRAPLILCFDFNVEPGVCALIQEQTLPGQFERVMTADGKLSAARLDRPVTGSGVIGEVHIPRNSNTPAVCKRIVLDYGGHRGAVRCYGDATGGARGSAKVQGSDWDLIERELRPVFGPRLSYHVRADNPAERARVNAVNSRLRSSAGVIRMMVDPLRAPNVVKDFEGVMLLEGGSGEIDKKETPKLTHLTDAIGYYVEREFPVSGPTMVKAQIAGA